MQFAPPVRLFYAGKRRIAQVNLAIAAPLAYHTFGGWKKSGFGDLNQHGPDAFRFYTRTKTITTRWPSGIKEGSAFNFKAMD